LSTLKTATSAIILASFLIFGGTYFLVFTFPNGFRISNVSLFEDNFQTSKKASPIFLLGYPPYLIVFE